MLLVQKGALGSQGNIVMEDRGELLRPEQRQTESCLLLREGSTVQNVVGKATPDQSSHGRLVLGKTTLCSQCQLIVLSCWPVESQLCWPQSYCKAYKKWLSRDLSRCLEPKPWHTQLTNNVGLLEAAFAYLIPQ